MSAADLMAVLIDGHLRLDYSNPKNPANDHLIFSKGHASPLYYSVLKAVGAIDDEELLTFRKLGSRLEGHPTPRIPPTDVATGSLGQGLPIGVGVAMAGRSLDQLPYRVWVLCGDSEMAEGSMWEAFQHAGWEGLDNLTAIIDVNRLGQTRETMLGWDLDGYVRRIEAFGWKAIAIDGHDVEAIEAAYAEAEATTDRPTAIVAKTKKGKGVKAVEDQPGKHGKPLEDPEAAIEELGGERDLCRRGGRSPRRHAARLRDAGGSLPSWELGDEEATRKAYGVSIAALADVRGDVVALDGEVSNSTHSEDFREAHPDRYFEMFIAEQQLVAAAVGMQVRGWTPFVSTFSAFLSRAYDFVRMARDLAREPDAVGLARRRLDRRGRAVADGAGGHRVAARDPRLDRPASERRQPDGEARRAAGRPRGHLVHPHAAGQDPGAHGAGRGRRDRRQPDRARGRRRRDHRLRDHARRGGQGRRAARRGRRPRPRARRLLDQADRRRGRPRRRARVRRDRHRRGPLARGRARRRGPRGAGRGRRARPRVKLAVREIPGSGTPANCWRARRSTPTRSPTPRQSWSPLRHRT